MYSVNRLIEDALCTFAERVKEYNNQAYSNAITTCLNHIHKHIYDEITLNDLANLLHISLLIYQNYLKRSGNSFK